MWVVAIVCIAQISINLYLKEREHNWSKDTNKWDLKYENILIKSSHRRNTHGRNGLTQNRQSQVGHGERKISRHKLRFTMNYRMCFDNSLRFIGTLLRYNNCVVPIMLTSIRSHSHLSSYVIMWIFPLCKGHTN